MDDQHLSRRAHQRHDYQAWPFQLTCSLPVVQVLFPEHSSEGAEWMISSSADGLISVMDLREGLDEDNAFRVRSLSSLPKTRSQQQDCQRDCAAEECCWASTLLVHVTALPGWQRA